MAKKNIQEVGKNVGKEIKQRGISDLTGRLSSLISNTSNNILRFVPAPIRNLLPFIANELDFQAPTADDIINKLTGKSKEQQESVIEDLAKIPISQELPDQKLHPQLKPGDQIIGNRGNYKIEKFLEYRNNRYFYQAIELPDSEPIIIQEFLFPKNDKDKNFRTKIQDIHYNFERISGIELADGRMQDFRLITPWEAIYDQDQNRCYLVFSNTICNSHSLGSYLAQNGAMSNIEVYQVLNQVLQSLQFLHTQKFILPSGIEYVQKYHGNLSLDSLVIIASFQGFLIYLRDLSLWEHQFIDDDVKPKYSPQKDLQDLGKIGLFLLAGNEANNLNDLKLHPTVNYKLKEFLLKLINNEFASAEIARENLPNFQYLLANIQPEGTKIVEPEVKQKLINFKLWVLGTCGILLLLAGIFWLLTNNKNQQDNNKETMKSIEKVAGIPKGKFTYTSEADGVWRYVVTTINLLPGSESLETNLKTILPGLELNYLQSNNLDNISRLKNEEVDFVITTMMNNNKNSELGYQEFAYDGLAVFVAFSKEGRKDSLPKALQGKITLEQIQKIYTGEITNWKNVKGVNGPDLEIKLYISPNEEAVKDFEQRVLKTQVNINKFRSLFSQPEKSDQNTPKITKPETSTVLLNSIIQDFESKDKFGSIGFDSLSKVYGQCSIYPLALQDGNKSAVSPLIQLNGKSVSLQETDLCNKSSYTPNSKAFLNQNYPLAYPLSVVYLRDNRKEPKGEKFAEVLKTKEVQCLLKHTGLVTLQPLNNKVDCQR